MTGAPGVGRAARGSWRPSYPFCLSSITRAEVRQPPPKTHPKAPRSLRHPPEKPKAKKWEGKR